MELLLFSDLHRDREAATRLVELTRTHSIDVAVGAGDFASIRNGLRDTLDILRDLTCPLILVPGNAETDQELRQACDGWENAHVLHGECVELGGIPFFGLGGAVPVTPFGAWSFDLDEEAAAALLLDCPTGAVLVTHSPPLEVVDINSQGRHLGSRAILAAIEAKEPRLAVCGHIHDSWEQTATVGKTTVINAGPRGVFWTLENSVN